MLLRAVSTGYAVPRTDFDAVVHSVFRSAVNLQARSEDHLLTLLVSDEADLPQGIRLEHSSGLNWNQVAKGSPAVCRSGLLTLGAGSLVIDIRDAAQWKADLGSLRVATRDERVLKAWQSAWNALEDWQLRHDCGIVASHLACSSGSRQPAWVQQVTRCVRDLQQGTACLNPLAGPAIEPLIGLGPGLTPSGDDLVIGYLIGLRCTANGGEARLRFLADLCEAVVRHSARTNDISRTYLFHAAHGQASSLLIDLALAVCAGHDRAKISERVAAALRVGHSSGADSITGLLLGLLAWDGPVPTAS